MCLVAQQTHQVILDKKLGDYDFFYLTTENYRVFFRWTEFGMVGFIFDTTISPPVVRDIIHGAVGDLDVGHREAMKVRQELDNVQQKYDSVKSVAVDMLGPLGTDLIKAVETEIEIDSDKPSEADVKLFIEKLEKSASMIIGPSRAAEMRVKIQEIEAEK